MPLLNSPEEVRRWLRWRRQSGKDTTVHVKGDERSGKSSFAIELQATLKPEWTVPESLFYDWTDLGPLIRRALDGFAKGERDGWPFFWGDEATNILDILDHNKVENKATKKLFRQWGILGALTILVDPDGRLDKYVMMHRAKLQVVMSEYVKEEWCPPTLEPRDCLSGIVRLQHRDPRFENEPYYIDQFRWTFPKPYLNWPGHWATYEQPKMASVGLRLGETSLVFEDAALMRTRNRLKVRADIQKYQDMIDGD